MSSASASDAGERPVDPPRDALGDLLDRLTVRLSVDPELRLEIRQELRSHLEESSAQFKSAGRSDADAQAEAIGALGDEQDLAEQLWRANRRRIRGRSLAVWGMRTVAPLLAIGLIFLLVAGAIVSWASTVGLMSSSMGKMWLGPPGWQKIADNYRDEKLARLPPDERMILELKQQWGESGDARANELLSRHPDDPALFAAAKTGAAVASLLYSSDPEAHWSPAERESRLVRALALLAEGEKREPDNALYPLAAAGVLFRDACTSRADPAQTLRPPGYHCDEGWNTLTITNPQRFEQALAALHRAATKPYYRSYEVELTGRGVRAIEVNRLADVWLRAGVETRGTSPMFYHFPAEHSAACHATDLARSGAGEEQTAPILRDLRRLAALLAGDARTSYQLWDAATAVRLADEAEARVRLAQGDRAGADAAWAQLRTNRKAFGKALGSEYEEPQLRTAGLLYGRALHPSDTKSHADRVPAMRRAEYVVGDQLGTAAVAGAVLLMALLCGVAGGMRWLLAPADARPARLFIGWRPVARVIALGAIAPLLAYFAYAWLTPLGGRDEGLNVTSARVVREYALLGGVIIALLIVLTSRGVRHRARELGIQPPTPRRALADRIGAAVRVVLLLTAAAVVVALAFPMIVALASHHLTWGRGYQMTINFTWLQMAGGYVIVSAAVIGLLVLLARRLAPRRDRATPERSSVILSAVLLAPAALLAAVATVLGRGSGLLVLKGNEWAVGVGLTLIAWQLLIAAAAWIWRERGRGGSPAFAAIATRSTFPVLLLAAVVLATVGLPLRWIETRAVRAAMGNQTYIAFLDDVTHSDCAALRDMLLAQGSATTNPSRK
jgi:hypothetical protein